MAKVLFNLPNNEHQEIKKKAASLGLTTDLPLLVVPPVVREFWPV